MLTGLILPQIDPFSLALQQSGGAAPTNQQFAAAQVDTAATAARAQVSTATLGQDWEYHAKLSEARQYLVKHPLDIKAYPYLASLVKESGGDASDLAEVIIAAATKSNGKRARIEAIRSASKERLAHFKDDDAESMQHEYDDATARMQIVVSE